MEGNVPDYVRRRCFGHLPWRVTDAGISEIPHMKNTQMLDTYLHDGITWSRLAAIAAQPRALGGLGLMAEGSVR